MARIGDTVDPRLMRADTSGILRGSAAGAAAMGQGIANLGAGLGQAAQTIGANKNAVKDGKEMAKAMLQLHGAKSEIGKVLLPVVDAFDSEEVRFSEKLGLARRLTPLIGAATQKQAQDIAAETRKQQDRFERRKLGQGDRALNLESRKLKAAESAARGGLGPNNLDPVTLDFNKKMLTDITPLMAGGAELVQQKIDSLDEVIEVLTPGEDRQVTVVTGPLVGTMPEFAKKRLLQNTTKYKDIVKGITFESLKEILGSQFTQEEAQEFVRLAWDDLAQEGINADKVRALKKKLQGKLDAQMKYVDQYKRLGYMTPDAGLGAASPSGQAPGAAPTPATSSRLGGFRQRREGAAQPAVPGAPAAPTAPASQQEFNAPAFEDLSPEEQEAHRERKRQRIADRAPVALPVAPGQAQAVIEPGRVRQPRGAQPVAPTQELPTGSDLVEGPGGVMYESIDPPIGPSFLRKVPQADVPVEGAAEADPVQAVPVPEPQAVTPMSDRNFARGARQAPVIPAEIRTATKIVGERLPRATSALAKQIQHDASAQLKIVPEFSPSATARAALRKEGTTLVNLDSNHSGFKADGKTPKKRVLDPKMILPDDATEQDKMRARMAIELMDELYDSVHGKMPKSSPDSRVLTRSQNEGRGRKGITHTELFAVTDNKMVNFLKTLEGGKEYANILRTAYGDLDKIKFFLPHSEASPGAKTDKGSTEADLALHFMKYL